jgi:hypothetical protein
VVGRLLGSKKIDESKYWLGWPEPSILGSKSWLGRAGIGDNASRRPGSIVRTIGRGAMFG